MSSKQKDRLYDAGTILIIVLVLYLVYEFWFYLVVT